MRTLFTLILCLAVLTGSLLNSANAQSAEDLRKWAEDARRRMNQEFERQRQRIDEMRKQLNEELDKLMGGNGSESAPAQPAPQTGASLGIKAGDIDEGMRTLLEIPEGQGVLVKEIAENSPASKTLKTWDVILSIDGKNVGSPADIAAALQGRKAGDKVTLVILRESAKQTVTVELTGGSASAGGATDLEGFLNESFEEGDKADPKPEEGSPFQNPFGGGNNPFGEGQNPFGNGEGMQQLQERMQELFQNPERLQQLMEQFREMMQGRNPQNPNGGEGQNPLGGGLEDFLRGLEGNQGGNAEPQGEPTPAPATRPWIGISGVNPNADMQAAGATGVVVTRVTEGGPAAKAGLQRGDIIVAFGDTKITDRDALKLAIDNLKVGETIKVTYKRGGETKTAEIVVASR